MFSELRLSNFRVFDEEVVVRFRPITVLIGNNNSGKSSVIRFLLMLDQSAYSSTMQFPAVGKFLFNEGGFQDLKNVVSDKSNLGFELSFCAPFSGSFDPEEIPEFQGGRNVNVKNLLVSAGGNISYRAKTRKAILDYSLVEKDSNNPYLAFQTSIEDDYVYFYRASTSKFNEIYEYIQNIDRDIEKVDRDQFQSVVGGFLRKYMVGKFFREELHSVQHIPPTRSNFDRVVDISSSETGGSYGDSSYAISELYRFQRDDSKTYEFILGHLRNVAGIGNVRFEEIANDLVHPIANNKNTNVDVPIVDFGFGVSQCLPILVHGAGMIEYSTLMVEQPESQLHPAAHMEMGSYFADLWKIRGVGSIIETHSDNLLLRLRRLVGNGYLSPQDISVAYFTLDNGVPDVKNLNIDEKGGMEPGLPMEFFGSDIIEGLHLGAGS